jgi:hypothetical protein
MKPRECEKDGTKISQCGGRNKTKMELLEKQKMYKKEIRKARESAVESKLKITHPIR